MSLVGKAGTGKTLLALAAGLHKTIEDGQYTRLLVSRPVFPLGRDIGFLPGDLEETLLPWMQPIFDNFDFLMDNLTPHEIKTIITRVGYGTKIIITGDPYQIDNPYVDVSNNGLTYVVERFKNEAMAGHVTLTKGERSKLAELAANLL